MSNRLTLSGADYADLLWRNRDYVRWAKIGGEQVATIGSIDIAVKCHRSPYGDWQWSLKQGADLLCLGHNKTAQAAKASAEAMARKCNG